MKRIPSLIIILGTISLSCSNSSHHGHNEPGLSSTVPTHPNLSQLPPGSDLIVWNLETPFLAIDGFTGIGIFGVTFRFEYLGLPPLPPAVEITSSSNEAAVLFDPEAVGPWQVTLTAGPGIIPGDEPYLPFEVREVPKIYGHLEPFFAKQGTDPSRWVTVASNPGHQSGKVFAIDANGAPVNIAAPYFDRDTEQPVLVQSGSDRIFIGARIDEDNDGVVSDTETLFTVIRPSDLLDVACGVGVDFPGYQGFKGESSVVYVSTFPFQSDFSGLRVQFAYANGEIDQSGEISQAFDVWGNLLPGIGVCTTSISQVGPFRAEVLNAPGSGFPPFPPRIECGEAFSRPYTGLRSDP